MRSKFTNSGGLRMQSRVLACDSGRRDFLSGLEAPVLGDEDISLSSSSVFLREFSWAFEITTEGRDRSDCCRFHQLLGRRRYTG